ncbi:hypothetical protein GCM10011390_21690 [Aureimonas endophytica]|uniref:Uncharacterized protein n=1 Tax=Aureimonas endophytica TaxID=2027858 RepID=A0A917E3X2_9HYPH|nr:hypothetical protein [Aureimonas endophytica]GGE02483.1 hypothetical protein GCM10011390_21690 [Aureimonas endophytica]
MDADRIGPMLLGAAVGWMVYYFMRRFKIADPAVLAATIGAVLGGPVIKFIDNLAQFSSGANLQSFYFLGLGLGFFGYAFYVFNLVVLSAFGLIPRRDFEFMARCGPEPGELEFSELVFVLEEWSEGRISEEFLRQRVKELGLTRRNYEERKHLAEDDMKAIISEFEQKGLVRELAGTPARPGRVRRKRRVPAV